MILASKSAAWFEGRAHHIAPAGERPTTSRHSTISASREAAANSSKPNLMLCSVPINRTEQSPTLFGHTNTQACGREEVHWNVKVSLVYSLNFVLKRPPIRTKNCFG